MPGGQSGHPLSPYYRAGHEAWVAGEPTPFLPGPAVHRLRLEPVESDPAPGDTMEYRRLGRSGLKLSALSFGSWVTFGNQLDDEARPS